MELNNLKISALPNSKNEKRIFHEKQEKIVHGVLYSFKGVLAELENLKSTYEARGIYQEKYHYKTGDYEAKDVSKMKVGYHLGWDEDIWFEVVKVGDEDTAVFRAINWEGRS